MCQPSINTLRFRCRKGDPFQDRKGALVLTQGTKLSEENTGDEARDFTGEGKGTQEGRPASGLTVLGFMRMRLLSGLS